MGTCYLGTTTYNVDKIAEVLGLPTRVVPVITVALGWPEGDSEISDRIAPDAYIHDEFYHDYTDERIRQIYAAKEARDDSKQFVAENGKKTLAQVFTDVRYPGANNELFSKIFDDFIRRQGF